MNHFEHLKQTKIFDLNIFGFDLSITNGAITGFLAVFLVLLFFWTISRQAKLIPAKLQTAAEFIVLFIKKEMLSPLGKDGEIWIPFLVSLFSFILVCNLLGLIPGLLPPTSNINVTASLAIIVFLTVQVIGVKKNGLLGYIKSLIPPGIPALLIPFLLPIEIIGQLARPFSLSVRLFANMFAGHAIILTLISLIFVFKNFLIAPLPVIGSSAIMAFEIFVSFIQAFIFSYLASTYITGALKTAH